MTVRLQYAGASGVSDKIEQAGLLQPLLTFISGITVSALGACGMWMANRLMGKAAFRNAIDSGFEKLVDQLQQERSELALMLERERQAWTAERTELVAEIGRLRGEVDCLADYLRQHGITIPANTPPVALPSQVFAQNPVKP